jgi:hypothetical protein
MLSRSPQNGPSSRLPSRRLGWLVAVLGVLLVTFAGPAYAAWPGANGHIAFESDIPSGTCCNGIYTIAADGSGFARVFDDPSQDLSISEYSPDGRWVLVNRRNAGLCGGGSPIYAVRDNGVTQHDADLVLLDDPVQPGDIGGLHCTQDGRGVYSIDGSRIAFPRFNSIDAGINGVWVMNADGTHKARVAAAADASDVRWAFDGTQLSYQSGGVTHVVSADGSGLPVVSPVAFPPSPGDPSTWTPVSEGPPTSSPDGLKEVFLHCCYADTGAVAQVNVANADGSNVHRITDLEACPGLFCGIVGGDIAQVTWQPIPIVDASPPVITSSVSGTAGANGWFTSAVTLSWTVTDPDSGVFYTQGCDPVTISSETSGRSFTCFAINKARGTSRATRRIKIDLTDPSVACVQPSPVFFKGQAGARVKATVSDALSGPTADTASSSANTSTPGSFSVNVTGSDRAGRATTVACGYVVKRVALGETDLGPEVDFNPAGLAEAFSTKATSDGTLGSLSVYVDRSSSATAMVIGIYTDSGSNRPGTLLAQRTVSGGPVEGAWNTVLLPSVPVVAGGRYWIAILSPAGSGSLRFRDFCCGSSGPRPTEVSQQTNLTTLPQNWSTGRRFPNDGPLTAWAG